MPATTTNTTPAASTIIETSRSAALRPRGMRWLPSQRTSGAATEATTSAVITGMTIVWVRERIHTAPTKSRTTPTRSQEVRPRSRSHRGVATRPDSSSGSILTLSASVTTSHHFDPWSPAPPPNEVIVEPESPPGVHSPGGRSERRGGGARRRRVPHGQHRSLRLPRRRGGAAPPGPARRFPGRASRGIDLRVRSLRGCDRACHRSRAIRLVVRVRRPASRRLSSHPRRSGRAMVATGRGGRLAPPRGPWLRGR